MTEVREIYRVVKAIRIHKDDYLVLYVTTPPDDASDPKYNPIVCSLDSAGNRVYTWIPTGQAEPVTCDRLDIKSHFACPWIELETARTGGVATKQLLIRIRHE